MSLQVFELQETRSENSSNGRTNAMRRFRIFNDASPIQTPAAVKALFGGDGIPQVGDQMIGDQDLLVTGFTIRHLADLRNTWEIEFTYENVEVGQLQPAEVGYTDISIDYETQFVDAWRANPTIPTGGNPSNQTSTAPGTCAGTPIDSGGEPLTILKRSSTIVITETVVASTMQARSLSIRAARGKRNSDNFQGAPPGQVLYHGAQAQRIGLEKFQIVHRFSSDEWFHMFQAPIRDPDGKVALEIANGISRAKVVNWYQPYLTFYEFNTLSENF